MSTSRPPATIVGLDAWMVLVAAQDALVEPVHSIAWTGLAILHLPVRLVVPEPGVLHGGGEPAFVWLSALWWLLVGTAHRGTLGDVLGLVAWSIGPRATRWLTDPRGRTLV